VIFLTDTNTGVKNSLKEGEENVKVLGMKAEADGSDIEVTSVKVTLVNNATTTSEKLSNYLDEVTVYMGSKKLVLLMFLISQRIQLLQIPLQRQSVFQVLL